MALNQTEGKHAGEFIASEANGRISRDNVTLITGQKLNAGAVLGKITASGKYTAVAPAAGTGEQVAVAVLYDNCDATSADKTCTILARDCELNQAEMDFGSLNAGQIVTAIAQLAAVGIMVRAAA